MTSQNSATTELVEAIRLTVEYVGLEVLPPIDGWSWFDAMKKYAPDLADHFVAEAAKYADRRKA